MEKNLILNQMDINEIKKSIIKTFGNINETDIDIIISSLTEHNPFMPTHRFFDWLDNYSNKSVFKITKIPLNKMNKWHLDEHKNLYHESNTGSFSITHPLTFIIL